MGAWQMAHTMLLLAIGLNGPSELQEISIDLEIREIATNVQVMSTGAPIYVTCRLRKSAMCAEMNKM
jgi:hypothetical protein